MKTKTMTPTKTTSERTAELRAERPPMIHALSEQARSSAAQSPPAVQPPTPAATRPLLIDYVVEDPTVKRAYQSAAEHLDAYALVCEQLRPLMFPEAEAARVEARMTAAKDVLELETLRDQVGRILASGTPAAAMNAGAVCKRKLTSALPALESLGAAVEVRTKQLGAEVVDAEKTFFGKFGLARQPTILSRAVEALTAGVAEMRSGLAHDINTRCSAGSVPVPSVLRRTINRFAPSAP